MKLFLSALKLKNRTSIYHAIGIIQVYKYRQLIISGFLVAGVFANQSALAQEGHELKKVAGYLAGSFTSLEQSLHDSDYYHINLDIIPIWKERTDGYWFYVEQALASIPDRPYRQRVYHLTQKGEIEFESEVYTLTDPLRFTGKPTLLDSMTPDSLQLKEGCSVILKKTGIDLYAGGTNGKNCASDLRGATYATSSVTLTPRTMESWDQGFDKEGMQVWGAKKGPYIFIRKE